MAGALWLTRADQPDPRRLLADSLITLEAGNCSAARSNGLAAVAAAPRFGIAQAVLARAYLKLEDGLAAEAALGRAQQAGVPADRVHQLRAPARLLQGDPAGAIAQAGRATPRYADYAAGIRARVLAAQGDLRAGKVALEKLVAAASGNGQAWTDLTRLRLTGGDLGGASAAAEAARLSPSAPRALTLAGEVMRARYGLVAALPGSRQR